jgi:predicted component of type VI protein secretion system
MKGSAMPAQLVALTEGPNILLDKPILLFGRNPECDIQIDSRKVSRRHCCIAQVNDYLVVRDLGSTNGIRINGVRVTEGRLRSGDELTIGNHRYTVRWDPLEARAMRPAVMAPEPEPARPTGTIPEDDDELLESSDEPIPLEDPKAPRLLPPMTNTAVTAEKPSHLRSGEKPHMLGIPDNLNLAPTSDSAQRHRSKPG